MDRGPVGAAEELVAWAGLIPGDLAVTNREAARQAQAEELRLGERRGAVQEHEAAIMRDGEDASVGKGSVNLELAFFSEPADVDAFRASLWLDEREREIDAVRARDNQRLRAPFMQRPPCCGAEQAQLAGAQLHDVPVPGEGQRALEKGVLLALVGEQDALLKRVPNCGDVREFPGWGQQDIPAWDEIFVGLHQLEARREHAEEGPADGGR